MENGLFTADLDLANHQAKGIWTKNIQTGVLAKLSGQDPEIKVGATDFFTFLSTAKAELVGEGAEKSSQKDVPGKVTARTYKLQVTYRMSDEVLIADEEYQIGLVDGLVARIATALSRALDLLAIHGINPLTGTVSGAVTDYLNKSGWGAGVVNATTNPQNDVDDAAGVLQGNGYNATGIGFDPTFAGKLARARDDIGNKLFPELGLGFNVENFQGLPAASSNTVSGKEELETVEVLAIMGDFINAFKWAVARQVPLETILYGDPDGNGDLKRTNEIAIRAESYIGFAFLDPKAFVLIKGTPQSS